MAKASNALKVLMLHGYTQSGPLFHAKTKALEKILHKQFPGISLHYPTGPLRLNPKDIPGYDPSRSEDDDPEAYGWWRRSNTAEPPEYVGLEDGLSVIANVLKSEGPFDGVMGFSQGAAMATMVTSLLQPNRRQAFSEAQARSNLAIQYPQCFAGLDHPPLKFCVVYAGFIAPGERYRAFYEPSITTPMCHFVGSLDTVVEEDRTELLVNASGGRDKTTVVVHPGGHFVPSSRQYIDTVVGFIRAKLDTKGDTKDEVSVEDMDVPF